MNWLIVTIVAYFCLAFAFLADKHLLDQRIPNPKIYVFYAGVIRFFMVLLIPFVDFRFPSITYAGLAILSGISFFIALFWFYSSLRIFEVSRIVPAIGALTPIFSLALAFMISGGQEILYPLEIPAFVLLVLGSFLISFERGKNFSVKSLAYATTTSFFFSLYFILARYVYDGQPFLSGLIWLSFGGFIMAIIFFSLFKDIRSEIFVKRETINKGTATVFFGSKIFSGLGGLLQNYAVFLAPSYVAVAFINGLQGTQYAFLLLLAVFLSVKYPKIVEEEISKGTLVQKSISIILIICGLLILYLF